MPGPELAIVPVAGVIFLAFFERRWTLPTGGANLLAIVIALGGAWWLVMQVPAPSAPSSCPCRPPWCPTSGRS